MLLTQHPDLIDPIKLKEAIVKTFAHRGTMLDIPINFDMVGMAKLQSLWARHLRNLGDVINTLLLPGKVVDVINALNILLRKYQISSGITTN